MRMRRLLGMAGVIAASSGVMLSAVFAAKTDRDEVFQYYYNQLTTPEARGIYDTLAEMLENGDFENGRTTVDLVERNVLENRLYDREVLMADFSSARDAFMLDYSDIFYVEFDKMSVTQTQLAENQYQIALGIGREDTYFYDGFEIDNVEQAIRDFDRAVDEIAETAKDVELQDAEEGEIKVGRSGQNDAYILSEDGDSAYEDADILDEDADILDEDADILDEDADILDEDADILDEDAVVLSTSSNASKREKKKIATPSNAAADKATPSNAAADKDISSNAAADKATPGNAAADKATPSNAVADKATSSNATPSNATESNATEMPELSANDLLMRQIRAAYIEIINRVDYALEKDAEPENVLYVRTPYGALVRGEAVCEGYARALKAVLDELGIDNVLVQGVFVDADKQQPHMWNYVKMDDNCWYLLDATMEDGWLSGAKRSASEKTEFKYFLRPGSDSALDAYQPSGMISLSQDAFEFTYPELAGNEYQPLSTAFTGKEESEGVNQISYHGNGMGNTQKHGIYILGSYDGKSWYYYEHYTKVMNYLTGNGLNVPDPDYEHYFLDRFGMAYFAVTRNAPPEAFDPKNQTDYYEYVGSADNIHDQSQVGDVLQFNKVPPVVVTRTPVTSRLDDGKTYDVEITYSEKLKLVNPYLTPALKGLNAISSTAFSAFEWDGDRTISFKLSTERNYNFVTNYYFQPENLIGAESLKQPRDFGFTVVNGPTFACPKVVGGFHTAHANTPALISDGDLSVDDWKDKDGNLIGEDLPSRLALVASPIVGSEEAEKISQIEADKKVEVLASRTYEISLGLCSNQVAFVTGKRVKVFVPFPEGDYTPANVSFKAYHFGRDGKIEELDCITTEYGIVMMCDKFSPFTVVATPKAADERKVMMFANGKGTINQEILTLKSGEEREIIAAAEDGYVIDCVLLNGEELTMENGTQASIILSYQNLTEGGNTLEVSFVSGEIDEAIRDPWSDKEPEEGDKPGETDKPEEGDKPGETDKPEEGDKPGETDKPEEGDKPGETDKPEEGDKPGETDKPEEGDKPGETDKPGEGNKPGETDKPEEDDKSEDSATTDENRDSDDDSGSEMDYGTLMMDPVKGLISSRCGLITSDDSSSWVEEQIIAANGKMDSVWKLRYKDGSFARGSIVTEADGSRREQYLWEMVNGNWWPFDSNGYAKTGWLYDRDYQKWFYLHPDKGMQTGWIHVNGNWYYMNVQKDGTQGAMYASRWTPDGYYVKEDGSWDGQEPKNR